MLGALAVLAAVGAFWLLLLAPKRSELSKLNEEVQASETALQAAQQEAEQFAQARLSFPSDYTTVARLGKAVPVDPDVPSLVVQLDRAAKEAGVDFRKLNPERAAGGDSATPPATPSPPSSDSGATGASGASSGATGAAGSTSSGATGPTGASGSASAPAAADATLTSTMPLGVEVGPAGLSIAHYSLNFEGSFFKMADFVHNIRSLVQRRNRQLYVSGRLLTLDGLSFAEGNAGFPQVAASITVTAYLLPQSQGLFAGATTQGPAGASTATPAPPPAGSPSAPPTAVVGPR
jgi:Tfp pilus assembly protein PilO